PECSASANSATSAHNSGSKKLSAGSPTLPAPVLCCHFPPRLSRFVRGRQERKSRRQRRSILLFDFPKGAGIMKRDRYAEIVGRRAAPGELRSVREPARPMA